MFRCVTLGGYHKHEEVIRNRLCDTDDTLAGIVRHLTLQPYDAEEASLLAEAVSTAWSHLSNLQTLWYVRATLSVVIKHMLQCELS
jgi:hypothetical protein